jgi:hypothetical protein
LYLYQGWFVHTKTNQLALIRWLNWILIFWQLRWFQMEYIETSSCCCYCWLCCLQAKASREAPHMNYFFIDILEVHGMCCWRSPSMSGSVITLAVFCHRAYAIICTTFFHISCMKVYHEWPTVVSTLYRKKTVVSTSSFLVVTATSDNHNDIVMGSWVLLLERLVTYLEYGLCKLFLSGVPSLLLMRS